ncbi:CheR family methyltransferase [Desertibaculum subflavum]|uniref:CheR family methyltransferase n=1 Tax=Desertibaculum subflavum TaxID=2268458 RepID=UPI000E6672C3
MNPWDFDFIAGLLKQKSGLIVSKDKVYLLESRLVPVARKHGHGTLEALIGKLRTGGDDKLLREVVEAMTTNESFFFRDNKPFEVLQKETLPFLLQSRAARKQIRIWCAACSTGQEPYSIAMILKDEAAKLAGWKIEIVGTDLSTDVLDRARNGLYSQFEVQRGLPIQLLLKNFAQKNEMWQINADLRSMVQYRQINLLDDLGSLGQFDVVFCRNVLIYFDQQTKTQVLDKISRQMPQDGVLFLGGAETVLGISERFKPMPGQRGVYAMAA